MDDKQREREIRKLKARLKRLETPKKRRGAKPKGREIAFMDLCYAFFEAEPRCHGQNRRAIITELVKRHPEWAASRCARRLENMLLEGERLRRMRPPTGHVFVQRYGRLLITRK